jgi:hypothetical protein
MLNLKTKITGVFRGLLRRFDDRGSSPAVKDNKRSDLKNQPASSPKRPPVLPTNKAPANLPPAKSGAVRSTPSGGQLALPISSIVSALPADLRSKLAQPLPEGATFSLSTDKVIQQLSAGAVKVTFGELRASVPEAFIECTAENDAKQISLPLNEIISRLNPSQLPRRTVQKLEVSEEIAGPFGLKGKGVSVSSNTKTAAPLPKQTEPAAEKATPAATPVVPPPSFVPRNPAPAPTRAPAPAPARPAPSAPKAAPAPIIPKPAPPQPAPAARSTPPPARPPAPQPPPPMHMAVEAPLPVPSGELEAEGWWRLPGV